jgi:hypothetical protein
MTIDPFELHPETEKGEKKARSEILTKDDVLAIINEMVEKIECSAPKIWGYERNDILEVLEEMKEKIYES